MVSVRDIQRPEAAVNKDFLSHMQVERRKRHLRHHIHEIDDAITDVDPCIKILCKIRGSCARTSEGVQLWRYAKTHFLENIERRQNRHRATETVPSDPDLFDALTTRLEKSSHVRTDMFVDQLKSHVNQA